jgi:hypothetical protein
VATRIGKSPHSLSKFTNILIENWYTTEESLKAIESKFWTENKFPNRLVTEINSELGIKPSDDVEMGGTEEDIGPAKNFPKSGGFTVGGADHRVSEKEVQAQKKAKRKDEME